MIPPPERALQACWAALPLPASLHTVDGLPLRVLHRGRPGTGPGPDFRAAVLLDPAGRARRGDVEVHRRARDWDRHGHAADAAYTEVCLHVLGEPPAGERLPGWVVTVVTLPVSPAQAQSPLPPWRDGEGARRAAAGPALVALLDRLAWERLRLKAARIQAAAEPDQAAYALWLRALGAGGASVRMAALAEAVPYRWLVRAPDAETAAVWLRAAWPGDPDHGVGRPVNRPARRLAAAAHLLWAQQTDGPAAGLRRLAALPAPTAVQALALPGLLGRERAAQLLVDAAYPFALACAPRGEAGADLTRRWLALPGGRFGRTAALATALGLGPRPRNGLVQGLLALERVYCRAGAWAVCPLRRCTGGCPCAG